MLADNRRVLLKKIGGLTQVNADHLAIVLGVPGDRHNQRKILPCRTKHARHVHQRRQLLEIQQCADRTLRALLIERSEKLTVTALQQFSHLNGGDHIRHRIMRRAMLDTVGRGEFL